MPKNIIFAVTGLVPNTISETMYVLSVDRGIKVDKILIATTESGRKRITAPDNDRPPFIGKQSVIEGLCSNYRLPMPEIDLRVMVDATGNELNDVKKSSDIEAAADFIMNTLRDLSSHEDSILHCVYAGGRRIMATFLGLALSIFGRHQDHFYYVSAEPKELLDDTSFYYPPKAPLVPLGTDIRLVLEEIKVLKLGEKYQNLLPNHISYSEAVERLAQISTTDRGSMALATAWDTEGLLITSKNTKMQKVISTLNHYAKSKSVDLIALHGERGTGKGVLARYYWRSGPRNKNKFLSVSPGSVQDTLFESELFGHKKGAYTGANADREGMAVRADGGIIFIDEVGKLGVGIQAKLLNFVEERKVYPLGSDDPKEVNVNLVLAFNEDVKKLHEDERLLPDFYDRWREWIIEIPPLRDRREDVVPLAMTFLKKYSLMEEKPLKEMSDKLKKELVDFEWPGNVRQLEHKMKHAVVEADKDQLILDAMDFNGNVSEESVVIGNLSTIARSHYKLGLDKLSDLFERLIIEITLKSVGSVNKAASALDISRTTLSDRMKRLNIDLPE